MHYKYVIMAVGYEWQATYIRNILQCHAVRACPVRTILNGCRHRRWKITIKYHTNDSDGILTVMWNMIIEEGVWGVMVRQFYANRDGNFSLYIIILQNRKKKNIECEPNAAWSAAIKSSSAEEHWLLNLFKGVVDFVRERFWWHNE